MVLFLCYTFVVDRLVIKSDIVAVAVVAARCGLRLTSLLPAFLQHGNRGNQISQGQEAGSKVSTETSSRLESHGTGNMGMGTPNLKSR